MFYKVVFFHTCRSYFNLQKEYLKSKVILTHVFITSWWRHRSYLMLNDAVCFLLMSLLKQYVLILILHVGKCFMIYLSCTPTKVNKCIWLATVFI